MSVFLYCIYLYSLQLQRESNPSIRELLKIIYVKLRSNLKREIKLGKRKILFELRIEIARHPWGLAFETLMGKRRPKKPVERCPVKLLQIIQLLFPTHGPPQLNSIIDSPESTPVPIMTTEIEKLADRLKCGKAPGPDGLPGLRQSKWL